MRPSLTLKPPRALDDEGLVRRTHDLARCSRETEAELLAHLAEIDRRRLHLEQAYPSLFELCRSGLGMSRSASGRRVRAARFARRVPEALDALAAGRVSLCGLVALGSLVDTGGERAAFEAALDRSTDEIEALVRSRQNKAPPRDRIRRVGSRSARRSSPARSERGRDRSSDAAGAHDGRPLSRTPDHLPLDPSARTSSPPEPQAEVRAIDRARSAPARPATPWAASETRASDQEPGAEPTAAASSEADGAEDEAVYTIQLTAGSELVGLLEEVRALAAHRQPDGRLEELLVPALRLYRDRLRAERFGGSRARRAAERTLEQARAPEPEPQQAPEPTTGPSVGPRDDEAGAASDDRPAGASVGLHNGQHAVADEPDARSSGEPGDREEHASRPQESNRYIPKHLRRHVFDRDGGRCTYTHQGRRCPSRNVEVHHRRPWARGGSHHPENMTLLCPAHNRLRAEQDYGHRHVQARIRAARSNRRPARGDERPPPDSVVEAGSEASS